MLKINVFPEMTLCDNGNITSCYLSTHFISHSSQREQCSSNGWLYLKAVTTISGLVSSGPLPLHGISPTTWPVSSDHLIAGALFSSFQHGRSFRLCTANRLNFGLTKTMLHSTHSHCMCEALGNIPKVGCIVQGLPQNLLPIFGWNFITSEILLYYIFHIKPREWA